MTDAVRHELPRVGLTGGIGSGKSTALAYLRELGAEVISSDAIVHGLYERPAIVAAIARHFGPAVIADGRVDRAALAVRVFADDAELQWLEHLLHPHVRQAIDAWARNLEAAGARPALLVAEVPVLFEAGFANEFDYTVVITAPQEVRRRRLAAKHTSEDLDRRLARQLPEEEKLARCDFSYVNVGSRRRLRAFLSETVARILAGHQSGAPGAAP